MKIDFDLAGALKSGYSEKDVTDYLRAKGHSPDEITSFFIGEKGMANRSLSRTSSTRAQKMQEAFREERAMVPAKLEEYKKQIGSGSAVISPRIGGVSLPGRSGTNINFEDVLAGAEDYTRTGASAAVGGIGSILGGPFGANVGFTATDEALRAINKRPTGSFVSGTQNPLLATAENVAVGEIGGRLINKGAAMFKEAAIPGSVVGDAAKLKPTFSRYFDAAPISQRIEETGLKGYSKIRQAEIQKLAQEEIDKFIKNETGRSGNLVFLKNGQPIPVDSAMNYELNQVIDNPLKLQDVLTKGSLKLSNGVTVTSNNLRQGLAAHNLQKMMTEASVPNGFGEYILDGKKLWADFANPTNKLKYDKLYGAANTARHAEFFKSIGQATKPDGSLASSMIDNTLKHRTIGLTGGIAASLIAGGGSLSRTLASAGGLASIYVVGKGSKLGLSALLNNPESARIMAAAARGGALNMSQEAAARILGREVIGYKVKIMTKDGSEINGFVNNQGQIEEESNP